MHFIYLLYNYLLTIGGLQVNLIIITQLQESASCIINNQEVFQKAWIILNFKGKPIFVILHLLERGPRGGFFSG